MDHDELVRQVEQLQRERTAHLERIEHLENFFRTANTPLWERLVFRLDGWGPWFRQREEPGWRPWRRWWRS